MSVAIMEVGPRDSGSIWEEHWPRGNEEQEVGRSERRWPYEQVLKDEQKSARQPAGARQAGACGYSGPQGVKARGLRGDGGGSLMGPGLHWGKQGAIKKDFLWRSVTFSFLRIFFLGTWLWWSWKWIWRGWVEAGRSVRGWAAERGRRPTCSHRAGKRSWTEVPERVSLGSLLGLFIDPILSTNLWSDGVGWGHGGGAALPRGLVFVTFLLCSERPWVESSFLMQG